MIFDCMEWVLNLLPLKVGAQVAINTQNTTLKYRGGWSDTNVGCCPLLISFFLLHLILLNLGLLIVSTGECNEKNESFQERHRRYALAVYAARGSGNRWSQSKQ
jgi:hypothetical protein